jgi:hypothetical protein
MSESGQSRDTCSGGENEETRAGSARPLSCAALRNRSLCPRQGRRQEIEKSPVVRFSTTAAIQHELLSESRDVERMPAFWKERFEDLKQILTR